MTMLRFVDCLLVGLGGFLGANVRYFVVAWLAARLGPAFPYGTLAVNVTGSLVAGLLVGMADARGLSSAARLLFVTGFLGGYTTFSAITVETARLVEQSGLAAASANVVVSFGAGLTAAALGLAVGRAL